VNSVVAADLTVATIPGAEAHTASASAPTQPTLPRAVDIAIIGGGCSGLATAVRLATAPTHPSVLILEGTSRPDTRSWCSWDDGSDPLPEARSATWDRWEVRTDHGTSTGFDPQHPYMLVRAADRRAAADRRVAGTSVRILDGAPVTHVTPDDEEGLLVRSALGTVQARSALDARGPRCPEHTDPGHVLLHQRFVGHWITTTRPVFDDTTVTLMDFTEQDNTGPVRFVYVLPTSPTTALVESTIFSPDADDPLDHHAHIRQYIQRRWALTTDEWHVDEEEHGCIPMTDAPPSDLTRNHSARWAPSAAVIGTTRPSSGYGFARSNRHSNALAQHLTAGTPVQAYRDRARTRLLDAVFLRFLRDRPDEAAEAFRRLMALPGPLVVRFMSERSTMLDEVRIILALQKRPFLAALGQTIRDSITRIRQERARA
jgi:lycopene beta-cyclase